MEVVFAVRGEISSLNKFITTLQGKFLPFNIKLNEKGEPDENGKEHKMNFQLGVKPYQIYGVSFPKEHKDKVLASIFGGGATHKEDYNRFDKWIAIMRKFLGLKPIGKFKTDEKLLIVNENLDFIGLGIKEDKQHGWGEGL